MWPQKQSKTRSALTKPSLRMDWFQHVWPSSFVQHVPSWINSCSASHENTTAINNQRIPVSKDDQWNLDNCVFHTLHDYSVVVLMLYCHLSGLYVVCQQKLKLLEQWSELVLTDQMNSLKNMKHFSFTSYGLCWFSCCLLPSKRGNIEGTIEKKDKSFFLQPYLEDVICFAKPKKCLPFSGQCNSSHRWRKMSWLGRGWMSMLSCWRAEVSIKWLTPWGKHTARITRLIFAVSPMANEIHAVLGFLEEQYVCIHSNKRLTMENKTLLSFFF